MLTAKKVIDSQNGRYPSSVLTKNDLSGPMILRVDLELQKSGYLYMSLEQPQRR
jgi:hypothetical protein